VHMAQLGLLQASAEVAHAAMLSAEAQLELTVIRAPRNGWVARTMVGQATAVRVGAPLLEVWYDETVTIEAWIDESSYSELVPGSRVQTTLLGLDDQIFSGHVRWLGVVTEEELKVASFSVPLAKQLAQARWVRAEIELDHPDPRLLPGLTVDVFVERRPHKWRFPSQPLRREVPARLLPPPAANDELRGEIKRNDAGTPAEHSL
jgi:multidrug resistance efflux pump